jgi:hypothetical protein
VLTDELQVLDTGSQALEQHCALPVQWSPVTVQTTLVPPPPPVPLLPPLPVLMTLAFPPPHPASATAAAANANVR